MKRRKKPVSSDPVSPSRRRLFKTAAWATSLSVTGGAMQLLEGCARESLERESVDEMDSSFDFVGI